MVLQLSNEHDSFATNSLIFTVSTVKYFLEDILLIYHFKRVNFLFENGMIESKTCKRYGHNGLMNKLNDDLTSHRYG